MSSSSGNRRGIFYKMQQLSPNKTFVPHPQPVKAPLAQLCKLPVDGDEHFGSFTAQLAEW